MSDKEIFLGIAIGDGYITKDGSLKFNHSVSQIEYAEYKKRILIENGFKFRKDRISPPSEGSYSTQDSIEFSTSSTSFGKEMRLFLYPEGKKIIPDELIITPEMWALIYQDDGRQNKSDHYTKYINGEKKRTYVNPWVNRYTIYTDCFDLHSIDNLTKSLLSYGIESAISYSNKNKLPHIHIRRKESKEKFQEMIRLYITNSMSYKLNLPASIS